jgi:hypothetical protein
MSYVDDAIAYFEGRIDDPRIVHRTYWLLLWHAHLTDYFQGGREVLLNELRSGPQQVRRQLYFGMTTLQEQAYCEWYCTHLYKGDGAIVELGTFLGSLTKSMVDGLRANPLPAARARKVQVYDLFWWDFIMAGRVQGTAYAGLRREGEWFDDQYRDCIRAWSDRVAVHKADLTQHIYGGEPIEFLMVDVMKYEALCTQVLRQFFPALRPGAILFHQDYLHFYEAWVHVIQYLLRDYFRPLTPIDGSAAFIFQCTRAIAPDACTLARPLAASWSDDLIEAAFAWSKGVAGADNLPAVQAAHVMLYAHLGRWERVDQAYRAHAAAHAGHREVLALRAHLAQQLQHRLPED